MTHYISGCQGAAGITKMKVTKATSEMPSPPPAGNEGLRLNTRGLTWVAVLSTGMVGDDCNDVDGDEEEEALQADDGSTQNVEDWWYSTRECEDWTVYLRPVKYDNGEANATASNVSEAETVLQYVTWSES